MSVAYIAWLAIASYQGRFSFQFVQVDQLEAFSRLGSIFLAHFFFLLLCTAADAEPATAYGHTRGLRSIAYSHFVAASCWDSI